MAEPGPPEWDPAEALVVGRSARRAPVAEPERVLPRAPSMPVSMVSSAAARPAQIVGWPATFARFDVAPGAVRSFAVGAGRVVYVEAGAPDVQSGDGRLRVHRANVPHLGGAAPLTAIEPGLMVRLAAGDLVLPTARARLMARNTTDRPTSLLVMGAEPPASGWLNPVRVLTLLLGVGAGILALDRARAVEAIASFIGTGGGLNASRLGFAFAALLLVGGALAPAAPRVAALVFLAGAAVGVVLATAGRWEERLEWWGAEYVLTAWTRLPLWSVASFGLALLALAGWRYRPRGGISRPSWLQPRRTRRRLPRRAAER
jgi:hypothetical protein